MARSAKHKFLKIFPDHCWRLAMAFSLACAYLAIKAERAKPGASLRPAASHRPRNEGRAPPAASGLLAELI